MRNIKFTYLKIAIVAVLGLATVVGCKKDNPSTEKIINTPNDEQLYNTLIKSGVKAENIKDVGEYYLVESDMLFKKNKTDLKKVNAYFENANENLDIIQLQENNTSKGKIASANIPNKISQWRTNNIISSINVENIKIYYNYPDGSGILWGSAWKMATSNWENIPECKISFYNDFENTWTSRHTDNAVTIVQGVPLSPNAYAYAEFPSSDNAGYTIHVNTNVNLSEGQRVFVLSHELGHCLGFRHTNWQSDPNEYGAPEGALLISGTPTTDANSIMNNGSSFPSVPSGSPFSNYDIIAAQTLYPYGTYDKWLKDIQHFAVYNNDFPPAIEWDANLVNTSTVSLEIFQYGVSKGMIAQNIPNNGSYSVNYRYYPNEGNFSKLGVQIKIISDANPNITDVTRMFDFYQD